MPNSRTYYESLLNHPNVRKALNLISKAEGADYLTLVGEGTNNAGMRRYGTSRHPKELGFKGMYNPRVNDWSTAAGRYQIVGKTWKGLQQRGIVGASFDAREQDIAAIALIDGRGALNDVLSGNVASFVAKTKQEWESFQLRTYAQVLSGWNGVGGGAPSGSSNAPTGSTAANYPAQSSYIPAVFSLSDGQSKLAKNPIPKEWRGMVVLVIASVIFFLVLSNSGYLK